MTQYKLPPDWQTSGEWDHHLGIGGHDDLDVVESPRYRPNLNPVFTPELLPGFTLQRSEVAPWQFVYETWTKRPAVDLRLSLLILRDPAECFSRASEHYGAHPIDNLCDDTPSPGSYSGQPVGDHCWAYTRGLFPPPRAAVNQSSGMVVITGSNLFTLGLSCVDAGVLDSLTESLARAVVERLKTWQLSV